MKLASKCLCTSLLIVFAAAGSIAQTSATNPAPCKVGLREAPDFRGVRLGMSPQEVAAILKIDLKLVDQKYKGTYRPEKIDPLEDDEFVKMGMDAGSKAYDWNISTTEPREGFEGIRSFYVWFFEDRLYTIFVNYDDTDDHYNKAGIKVLAKDLSRKFDLPRKAWAVNHNAFIECDGFFVQVMTNKGPDPSWDIYVRDTIATDKLSDLIKQNVKEYYLTNRDLILDKKREELRKQTIP